MGLRRVVAVCGLLFLLAAWVGGCGPKETGSGAGGGPSAPPTFQVGTPAPPFTLPRLDTGDNVDFPGDFKGRAVALTFFSPG